VILKHLAGDHRHFDDPLPGNSGHRVQVNPQFVGVIEVVAPDKRPVLVIPATAVLYAPYGDSVFALEESPPQAGQQPALVAKQKFVHDVMTETRGVDIATRFYPISSD